MIKIELDKEHGRATFGTFQRIITERGENTVSPFVKALVESVLFFGDGAVELFISVPSPGIKPAITNHFKVLFRDMLNQAFDEIHGRDGFFNIGIILMTVVMEGYVFAIIAVNT